MISLKTVRFGGFGFMFLYFLSTAIAQVQTDDFDKELDVAHGYQNIDSDSVLYHAETAFSMAGQLRKPGLQIDALTLIVKTHIKKGEYARAIQHCLMADSIASINKLADRQIEVMMYKGLVYQNSGLNAEGLTHFFNAKDLIVVTGNDKYKADLDYYLAISYYKINEFDKCRYYAREAVIANLEQRDSTLLHQSLVLIASSFRNADSIQKYLQLADDLSKIRRDNYKRAVLLNNKALFYKALGDKAVAKTSYLEAIRISVSNGYTEHLSNLYNNYAYLLMAEKKYDSVNLVLTEALTIARKLNNIDIEASVLDSYSDYYATIGDSAQSLVNYRQSVKLREQYRAQQQIAKSLFLSTVFETEKKEKEIARQESSLYRTNAILFAVLALFSVAIAVLIYFRQKSVARKARIKTMAQEKKLEVANAIIEGQDDERKRLAMDLHDGISPKIGSLKLLIDSKLEETGVYPEVIESIDDIDSNIREISHRMSPAQLESKGLVVALGNFIQSVKQRKDIDIQYFTNLQNRLTGKYEINIFFLFQELIHNALKHSCATELIVQLLDDDELISLGVEDNGKGFDPEKEHNGTGLKNIRQRVTYLNGEIEIDSVAGQGTSVLIEIKKQLLWNQ